MAADKCGFGIRISHRCAAIRKYKNDVHMIQRRWCVQMEALRTMSQMMTYPSASHETTRRTAASTEIYVEKYEKSVNFPSSGN